MIVDRDTGDEDDTEETIARMIAFLQSCFAAALKPFVHVKITGNTLWLEPHISLTFMIGERMTPENHDPGDEEPRVRVTVHEGRWIEL